jgi:lysyl endopeptidase
MRSATITCVLLVIVGSSLKNCQSFRPDGTRDINLMVGCGFLGREVRKIESERMDVTVNANPQTNSVTITIYDSVAQFIALHFSYLRLRDSEYIVIRDADHSNQVIELGSANVSATVDDLYTRPLYTKHLVVDFFLAIPLQDIVQDKSGDGCYGFHIDHYRYFAQAFTYSTRMLENTCGVDDSQEVACLRVDRRVFQKSNSVIRLLVHKSTASVFCTGWLVGSEGHVMTNNHCIGTPKEAASTTFEFLAQGETCKDHCDHPLACKGTVEASSALLVAASPTQELDYALLLLNLSHEQRKSLVIKYGFLSMRATAPNLHENIYIPQHPQGFGKRIATKNQAQKGKILSTNITGCNLKNSSLGYALYTKGGSSGSPIISHVDHNVVGLHYCGGKYSNVI